MTNKLKDVMIYILKCYPKRLASEMSNARLTKMVYLSDWKNALSTGKQISDVNWYFDNYGPFVNDIENMAKSDSDTFLIDLGSNMYGQPKKTFGLKNNDVSVGLSEDEKRSISSIVDETQKLYWKQFIKLVYSTHPVASSDRYTYLDLGEKAKEYSEIKEIRRKKIADLAV